MSWITIDGERHPCSLDDLQRWDAKAAEENKTREEVASSEFAAKPAPKKRMILDDHSEPEIKMADHGQPRKRRTEADAIDSLSEPKGAAE